MTSEELEKAIEISLKGQAELREQMNRTQVQIEKTQAQVEKTQAQVERTEEQIAKMQIRFAETDNIMRMHGENHREFSAIVLKHIQDEREINMKFRREMRDLRVDQSDMWDFQDRMRKDLDEMSVMMKNLLSLKSRNGNSGNE